MLLSTSRSPDVPDELRRRGALIKAILAAHQKKHRLSVEDREWKKLARPEQLPPEGDWFVWLVVAGRGFGKTRSGAEWITEQALLYPKTVWAVIGATWRDTQDVPLKAVRAALKGTEHRFNASDLHFYLPNGSEIIGYSADRPDRLRGANLSGAWCDELCHFQRVSQLWYEALVPAVRIGERPRILVTTTPRPTPLIKELMSRDDGSVRVVRGSTWDNAANLSEAALEELRRRYEGTRIGRQELHGELLETAENALWNPTLVEAAQWVGHLDPADIQQTVVAVDPSGSATGDATGIVTVVLGRDNIIYVMSDATCKGSPEYRYEQACLTAARSDAGIILYEAAYGGDNIAHGLRSAWHHLEQAGKVSQMIPALKASPTKSSKADRAHPVVALYEQTATGNRRVAHCGGLSELEDEMVQWEPGSSWSPNRIDALVHGVRYLARLGSAHTAVSSFAGMPNLAPIPLG